MPTNTLRITLFSLLSICLFPTAFSQNNANVFRGPCATNADADEFYNNYWLPDVTLDIHVLLEGAYDPNTDEMSNSLETLNLLPTNQPFNQAPWYYAGTETNSISSISDWVLVSFRTDIAANTEVAQAAALLQTDGLLYFPAPEVLPNNYNTPLYIVIETRNHLTVMSPQAVTIVSGSLTYDFSTADSYSENTNPGQKQLTNGKWVMFSGDMNNDLDVNGADKAIWLGENGQFNVYFSADLNQDGDVNGGDNALWNTNNGVYSNVEIQAGTGVKVTDDFAGNGPLLNYTTNNPTALPDVTRTNGRYRAEVLDNTGNITLHFNGVQGRLDAKVVGFPFEYIVRNIGIGILSDSQTAPPTNISSYVFAGIQAHVYPDFNSINSSHFVVGHRGGTENTVEGKNTVNGSSTVNDAGVNVVPDGRADLRLVGLADNTIRWYYQEPNFDVGNTADNWIAYRGTGLMPGTPPVFADSIYVGPITYAYGSNNVPFVGTIDGIELVGEAP